MSLDFAHLHLHTQYSLGDGIIKIDQLVERVKELGMTSCAITDHGNLHGAIEFYSKMKKAGLKPILGVEAYITEDADDIENEFKTRDNMHMVLLASSLEGWRNLVWLTSNANLHNFYYNPRISLDTIEKRNAGIIATTGCIGGIIAKETKIDAKTDKVLFIGGEYRESDKSFSDPQGKCIERLRRIKKIFGDRLYLELQDNKTMWEQKAFNTWAVYTARAENIPLVITCDVHYLRESDSDTRLLLGSQKKGDLSIEDYRVQQERYGKGYHVRSPAQMWEIANNFTVEDACENTLKIRDMCNLDLKLGEYEIPQFDITQEEDYSEFLEWSKKNGNTI